MSVLHPGEVCDYGPEHRHADLMNRCIYEPFTPHPVDADPDAPHCVAGDGACWYDGETAWTADNQECRGCTEAAQEYERENAALRRGRYAVDRLEER